MARYRKRPIEISAEQWWPGANVDGVFIGEEYIIGCLIHTPMITTLEGNMKVSPGDYIITGIKGEKYPCKPEIFEACYDLVMTVENNPVLRESRVVFNEN